MGTLYLVATPIGNLEDISQRALQTLKQVRLIAAEDTRHTAKLLSHFSIHTPITSYFEHNKLTKIDVVLRTLETGDVALVSDAGTPGINDPGYELIRAALANDQQVTAIPGPCAPVAALVVSGLPADAFLYLGYLPRKKNDRRQLLSRIADQPFTLIFLESPHRLLASLHDLYEFLGNRQIGIVRELTKLHEEILRFSLGEALDHFSAQPARGEFTLVLAGAESTKTSWSEEKLRLILQQELASGEPVPRVAALIAVQSGWPRREVYKIINQLQSVASLQS